MVTQKPPYPVGWGYTLLSAPCYTVVILKGCLALELATEEVDNHLEKFRDAETDTEKATAVNWRFHYLASKVFSSL